MKTDRWKRIETIFQNALDLTPSERMKYVVQACGEDVELRSELESLLANDNSTTEIDSLVAEDLRVMVMESDRCETGLQIGPYRLIRELDSGGMGVVYLGVRSDDQYFQIVAVKMIREGMSSPALVQRFRAERQILATLNHPNIGTILDGGETEDGRPFIVMEYVEGQPVTLACDNRGLSVRDRAALFRSVCSAVHFAHQKLVIHRDIKPSNVLVTPQGVVKLIDFGVSKPLRPELIPGELPKTETGHRLMTPDYASPEQLLGLELTTATDIYSLGVLLFELLTGSRPYTLRDISPARVERIVCEQETPKPSRVQGLSEQTRRELRGDLDRIVLMAMEKEPSRRYLSAQHFEEDLCRFLQARPVHARKATPIYRMGKFVQRHKTASLMACATLFVIGSSVLFYSWQSRVADQRLRQAETFADSAISDLTEKLRQTPASTEMRASLFQSALKYLEELRRTSGNDPRLLLKLSRAYQRVGDLEGSPYVANLGNSETAMTSYREALSMAIAAHDRKPDAKTTEAVIEVHERLGALEFFLGNVQKAHDNYQQSLSLAQDFWRRKPEDPTRRRLLAMSYAHFGDLQLDNLETNSALESFRAAFKVFGTDRNGEVDHDDTLLRLYIRMGGALIEHGAQSEALENLRASVTVAEALAQNSPSSSQAKESLFEAYNDITAPLIGLETLNVGDSKQAEIYARKALTIVEEMVASDYSDAWARNHLSYGYELMGDSLRLTQPAVAAEWYRKSLSLTKELSARYPVGSYAHDWIAVRDEELAAVLATSKNAPERLRLLENANEVWHELVGASPGKPQYRMSLMWSYCKLSDAELAVNDLQKARLYSDSSLPFFDEFKISSQSLLVLRDIGYCYESLGNVQRRISMDRAFTGSERRVAATNSREWYRKSAEVWDEWNKRGAATKESEAERRKVEGLLTRAS
jgi:serine/threonine protein kinase